MPEEAGVRTRNWSVEELRVLVAIYFASSFSIGDDARDECRAIADCFGRTPSSVDRQWRNLAAVVKGLPGYNIGSAVRSTVAEHLADPAGSKALAARICSQMRWPLESLIATGKQPPIPSTRTHGSIDELRELLHQVCYGLEFKVFSSGSQGFYKQRKVQLADGTRYQTQVTAVLIGSKADITANVGSSPDDVAFGASALLDNLEAKTFRTGRVGYYVAGRIGVGTERFQVGMQAVRIAGQ